MRRLAGFAVTPANRREVILLCGRLDGIPLAIELAAVQLRTLTLSQLSSRLEHRFSLLTTGRRGALPHQQTLRATTQWSYDLCSAAEQLLWARLSVFAGSFELAAAEALCAGGPLALRGILHTLIGWWTSRWCCARRRTPRGTGCWHHPRVRGRTAGQAARRRGPPPKTGTSRTSAPWRRFSRHAKDDDQLQRYHLLGASIPTCAPPSATPSTCPAAPEAARLAADLRAYWEISGLLRRKHWLTKILLRSPGRRRNRAWLPMTRAS